MEGMFVYALIDAAAVARCGLWRRYPAAEKPLNARPRTARAKVLRFDMGVRHAGC